MTASPSQHLSFLPVTQSFSLSQSLTSLPFPRPCRLASLALALLLLLEALTQVDARKMITAQPGTRPRAICFLLGPAPHLSHSLQAPQVGVNHPLSPRPNAPGAPVSWQRDTGQGTAGVDSGSHAWAEPPASCQHLCWRPLAGAAGVATPTGCRWVGGARPPARQGLWITQNAPRRSNAEISLRSPLEDFLTGPAGSSGHSWVSLLWRGR